MEVRPRGPWLTPAEAAEQRRGNPAGGQKQAWWTGTVDDQFTPIYMAMAQKSVLHDTIPPREVDAMDLTTIWALMGVGRAKQLRVEAQEQVRAADDTVVPMVRLTDEEKAARLEARRERDRTEGRRRRIRPRD